MIVSAPIHTISRAAAERPATGTVLLEPLAGPGTGPDTPMGDAAADPLAKLGNFVEDAARSRKALAEERLKHLDEQIRTLSLFDLAPGFLASHSARMASELESAATEFVGAFKALDHGGVGDLSGANLPAAYHDVMAQVPGGVPAKTEDREIAGRFASTAQTLRTILDIAGQDDEGRNSAGTVNDARDATIHVERLMRGLQSRSGSAGVYW